MLAGCFFKVGRAVRLPGDVNARPTTFWCKQIIIIIYFQFSSRLASRSISHERGFEIVTFYFAVCRKSLRHTLAILGTSPVPDSRICSGSAVRLSWKRFGSGGQPCAVRQHHPFGFGQQSSFLPISSKLLKKLDILGWI